MVLFRVCFKACGARGRLDWNGAGLGRKGDKLGIGRDGDGMDRAGGSCGSIVSRGSRHVTNWTTISHWVLPWPPQYARQAALARKTPPAYYVRHRLLRPTPNPSVCRAWPPGGRSRSYPVVFGPTIDQVLSKDSIGVDWMRLLQGIDVVIHLAAIAHRCSDVEEGLYDKINRQATAALARTTARSGARLIIVSSIAAQSSSSSDHVLTENDSACHRELMADQNSMRKSISPPAAGNILFSGQPSFTAGEGQHAQAHSACDTATTASFSDFDQQIKFAGD